VVFDLSGCGISLNGRTCESSAINSSTSAFVLAPVLALISLYVTSFNNCFSVWTFSMRWRANLMILGSSVDWSNLYNHLARVSSVGDSLKCGSLLFMKTSMWIGYEFGRLTRAAL